MTYDCNVGINRYYDRSFKFNAQSKHQNSLFLWSIIYSSRRYKFMRNQMKRSALKRIPYSFTWQESLYLPIPNIIEWMQLVATHSIYRLFHTRFALLSDWKILKYTSLQWFVFLFQTKKSPPLEFIKSWKSQSEVKFLATKINEKRERERQNHPIWLNKM